MSPSVSRRRQPGGTSQGRSSRLPAIWSALIVTAVWSIATGAYFAFREDVTQPMAEMQITYEKRIADLRAQFDRTMSQQFLDQERVQQQLNALLRWQATQEQNTSAITSDEIATGSITAKTPDCGAACASPVAEAPSATAASTAKSASTPQRHGARGQRRPPARPQQHGADQTAPAAARVGLGQQGFAPE